jgi:cytidylate kinase
MTENKLPNFAVSGWSASGSTILTLLLASIFKLRIYPATKIFRTIDKKLGLGKSGKALRKEFEDEVQPKVGKTIDNYIDYKLLNDNEIILESDIAGFRIGNHPKVFSIFLQTDMETRRKRAKGTDREKNETSIGRRDNILQDAYIKLWNIDIFDKELIKRKYSLVIDNSKLNIPDEIKIIIEALSEDQIYKNFTDWKSYRTQIKKMIELFDLKGQKGLIEYLNKRNLIVSTEDMMKEITIIYPEEVTTFPDKIQKMFLGQI